MQCNTILYHTILYHTIQYNTVQYDIVIYVKILIFSLFLLVLLLLFLHFPKKNKSNQKKLFSRKKNWKINFSYYSISNSNKLFPCQILFNFLSSLSLLLSLLLLLLLILLLFIHVIGITICHHYH